MRDPMTWSFPLGRLFGIGIRVHIMLPLVLLGLMLKVTTEKGSTVTMLDAGVVVLLIFVSVLLHEFGHCFAARSVDGDATEVLLWPLGGLAFCDVPHTPRAHLITTLGGPAVNLALCVVAGGALAFAGLVPPLNPFDSPYQQRLTHWRDGTTRSWDGFGRTTREADPAAAAVKVREATTAEKPEVGPRLVTAAAPATAATLSVWQVLAAQLFWVNLVLFLFNMLLPGYPMDCAQVLHAILWWRSDYRQATATTCYVGFIVMIVVGVYAMATDSVLMFALAIFIYMNCKQQLILLETGGEEAPFGYDFSQGYTSLEGPTPAAPPKRRRPNWYQRWKQRRAAHKAQREMEQREAEERRMDELLAKVQQQGLQSLTDEERRFLTRVSARYRGGKS
jgi:Zn-dependent protease